MVNPKQDRRRIISITLLAILAGCAGLYGYLRAGPEQELEPDRYYYRTSAGAVLFTHTDHQDLVEECESCHHEMLTGAEEPRSCRSCHPTEAPEAAPFVGCMECHDEPEYTVDFAEHDDLLEIHDPDCESCHTARAVTETFHLNCSDCHLQTAPLRFADPEGKVLCQSCHLK
jgi:hypothetical protein